MVGKVAKVETSLGMITDDDEDSSLNDLKTSLMKKTKLKKSDLFP